MLPLSVRKDIRDNQAKIDDAKAKLAAALGMNDLTLEVNNESIYTLLAEANDGNKETFTMPVAYYLEGLSKQLDLICKEPQVKAELHRVISAKKVVFSLNQAPFTDDEADLYGRAYAGVHFHNGVLELIVPVKYFWSNVDYISNPEEINITKVLTLQTRPAGTLPLTICIDLKATEAKLNDAVKKISEALGFECTLEWNPTASYLALEKEYEPRDLARIPFGEATACYLDGLGDNLATACKDDMVKEGLLDKFKTKKVGVVVLPTADYENEKAKLGDDSYVGLSFEGGNLKVVVPAKYIWCNMDNIKSLKIEKLL